MSTQPELVLEAMPIHAPGGMDPKLPKESSYLSPRGSIPGPEPLGVCTCTRERTADRRRGEREGKEARKQGSKGSKEGRKERRKDGWSCSAHFKTSLRAQMQEGWLLSILAKYLTHTQG